MGIYDRPYYRDEQDEFSWRPANVWSMLNWLIAICIGVYALDLLSLGVDQNLRVFKVFAAYSSDLWQPWRWFSFLTYAFVHAPLDDRSRLGILHIVFNMFILWTFGRSVESHLGSFQFLWMYLVSAVLCSVIYLVFWTVLGQPTALIGASGAVSTVMVYFIFLNPRMTLLLFGVVPIPAWVLGVGILLYDFLGSLSALMGAERSVAYEAHLIGAAVGALAFRYGPPGLSQWRSLQFWWRTRHLRVVRAQEQRDQGLADDADRVLEKVSRLGYDQLTAKEKKILEAYSRKLREKK